MANREFEEWLSKFRPSILVVEGLPPFQNHSDL